MSIQYASKRYYQDSHNLYKQAYNQIILDKDVKAIIKKLVTHFSRERKKNGNCMGLNLISPNVKLWGKNRGGSYCRMENQIKFTHNPSMGLILHEFAHYAYAHKVFENILANIENKGTEHHGTHFDICLCQINNYAQSKNYWVEILKKRNPPAIILKRSETVLDPANVI